MTRRATQRTSTVKAKDQAAGNPRRLDLGIEMAELLQLESCGKRLQQLATMVLHTPQQALYLYDHAGSTFVFGQAALSELYGYKPGEVEKRKGGWLGLIHPDDRDAYLGLRERMMENPSDEVFSIRMRIRTKSGGWEWIASYRRAFERDERGKAVSEIGMSMIITPLVEAEAAQRDTEARCHSLFEHNTAGLLVFDSSLRILDANPKACRLLGYGVAELQRLSVPDIIAPGARPGMLKLLRSMKGEDAQLPHDTTVEHKDGRRFEVMVTPTSFRGAKGDFHQGMLMLTDIGERKSTEAALRRESELNRILIDNAPIAIGLLAPDGRILRVNAVAEKLFGFSMSEVKGRELWKLPIMGPDEIKASRERFKSLLQGRERVTASITMRTRSGEVRQIETSTTAVRTSEGGIDFFVTTGTDVTDRLKLETEIIRVAETEHIRIGHDLHDGVGQTLTGIAALVEALESRLTGEDQKDARRIHELVKTAIAETRRLSHGLSPAAIKNRGLAGGLTLIAETVRENFRRECECDIDDPMPEAAQEAEIHLFRIAQEAVNNAIRHGGATKLRIHLRHHSATHGVLEISDNGTGFAAGKNKTPDPGIGLRVMEHRAHLINGELKIQSHKGRGVRVICQFPRLCLRKQT